MLVVLLKAMGTIIFGGGVMLMPLLTRLSIVVVLLLIIWIIPRTRYGRFSEWDDKVKRFILHTMVYVVLFSIFSVIWTGTLSHWQDWLSLFALATGLLTFRSIIDHKFPK